MSNTPRARRASKPADERITNEILRSLKERGHDMQHYGAVRKRVRELLAEYKDEVQVLLVSLELARRDGARFTPYASLSPGSFAYISDQFDVPRGAWFWHLWLQEEIALDDRSRDTVRQGIAHWIDQWDDAQDSGNLALIDEAKRFLEKLWANFGPDSSNPPPAPGANAGWPPAGRTGGSDVT